MECIECYKHGQMFIGIKSIFNQPIDKWDVSNVMKKMLILQKADTSRWMEKEIRPFTNITIWILIMEKTKSRYVSSVRRYVVSSCSELRATISRSHDKTIYNNIINSNISKTYIIHVLYFTFMFLIYLFTKF